MTLRLVNVRPRGRGSPVRLATPPVVAPKPHANVWYDFSPGDVRTAVVEVGHERNNVIVVDNLLRCPEAAVELAARGITFRTDLAGKSHFPGVRSGAPPDYLKTFMDVLEALIRSTYAIGPDVPVSPRTMFSITTTPPGQLRPLQRVPHYDAIEKKMISVVHFLFHKPFGGTCFFRHRSTGFESMAPEREEPYKEILDRELEEVGELPEAYLTTSNQLFEKTYDTEAQFNRLVIFPGQMFHSGSVNPEPGLVQDPRAGRLTLNTFLTFG